MTDAEIRPLTICAVGAGSSTHVATRLRWFAERGHRVFLLTASPSLSGIPGVEEVDLNAEYLIVREAWRRLRRPVRAVVYGLHRAFRPTPSSGLSEAPESSVSREAELPFGGPRHEAVHHVLTAIALLRAIRRCRPDVVHVYYAYGHYAWLTGLFGCRPLAVAVLGGDVLFEEQGSPTAAGKWLTVRLLRQANYVTTESDFLSSAVAALGDFGAKTERVLWGISLDKFRRRDASSLRPALGLKPEARVILSPKILRPFYRVHLVVEAMAIVRRSCPDAVLVVTEYLADPAYREQLLRRIAELELTGHIVFIGVFSNDDMPGLYSMSTLSIAVPSSDGMPQTLLESLACETPQVLCRLPRYEELVQHEKSAYFVDPTPESIAAGVIRLLEDEALRSRIARQGRRIVVEQANVDEQAVHLESRLRELVTTTRPRTLRLSALSSAGLAAASAYANFRRSG